MYISAAGDSYNKKIGTKLAVWEGEAYMTSSGLVRENLKLNRRGKVVSIARSKRMSERYARFGGLKKKIEENRERCGEDSRIRHRSGGGGYRPPRTAPTVFCDWYIVRPTGA